MSASKSSAQKLFFAYTNEELENIDEIDRICFPKHNKPSKNNNNNSNNLNISSFYNNNLRATTPVKTPKRANSLVPTVAAGIVTTSMFNTNVSASKQQQLGQPRNSIAKLLTFNEPSSPTNSHNTNYRKHSFESITPTASIASNPAGGVATRRRSSLFLQQNQQQVTESKSQERIQSAARKERRSTQELRLDCFPTKEIDDSQQLQMEEYSQQQNMNTNLNINQPNCATNLECQLAASASKTPIMSTRKVKNPNDYFSAELFVKENTRQTSYNNYMSCNTTSKNRSDEQCMRYPTVGVANLIGEMAQFLLKIGGELNDLCLTKMSEKSLQSMISQHISSIATMQRVCNENQLDYENAISINNDISSKNINQSRSVAAATKTLITNTSIGLRMMKKCFSDVIEKQSDLISRLTTFNKQKFRQLIEQNLSTTLSEIFQEHNRLNIIEMVTDLNVFVNTQRRALAFARILSITDRVTYSTVKHAFTQIQSCANQVYRETEHRKDRITTILLKLLINRDARDINTISRTFFKWHAKKQTIKEVRSRVLEGTSRIYLIFQSHRIEAYRYGLHQIISKSQKSLKFNRTLSAFQACLSSRLNQQYLYSFLCLKSSAFTQKLNWNKTILKVKGKAVSNALNYLIESRKRHAFSNLKVANNKHIRIAEGMNKLISLVDSTYQNIITRTLSTLISHQKISESRLSLAQTLMSKTLSKLFSSHLKSAFAALKTHAYIRPLAIKKSFKLAFNEIYSLQNPSLWNLFKTLSECFSSKVFLKHRGLVDSIAFKIVNLTQRTVTSFDASSATFKSEELHHDAAFEITSSAEYRQSIPLQQNSRFERMDTLKENEEEENQRQNQSIHLRVPLTYEFNRQNSKLIQSIRDAREVREARRVYNTALIRLDHIDNQTVFISCEIQSVIEIRNDKVKHKAIKLLEILRNRLKESAQRESQLLTMCKRIQSKHQKDNLSVFFAKWKNPSKSENSDNIVNDQISKPNSSDLNNELIEFQKELTAKRETYLLAISARMDELTIEKRAKQKCVAAALFANFVGIKQTREESLRRAFGQWTRILDYQRILDHATMKKNENNDRHVADRITGAVYLIHHLFINHSLQLKTDSMKALALNAVNSANHNNNNNNNNIKLNHILSQSSFSNPTPKSSQLPQYFVQNMQYSNNNSQNLSQNQQKYQYQQEQIAYQPPSELLATEIVDIDYFIPTPQSQKCNSLQADFLNRRRLSNLGTNSLVPSSGCGGSTQLTTTAATNFTNRSGGGAGFSGNAPNTNYFYSNNHPTQLMQSVQSQQKSSSPKPLKSIPGYRLNAKTLNFLEKFGKSVSPHKLGTIPVSPNSGKGASTRKGTTTMTIGASTMTTTISPFISQSPSLKQQYYEQRRSSLSQQSNRGKVNTSNNQLQFVNETNHSSRASSRNNNSSRQTTKNNLNSGRSQSKSQQSNRDTTTTYAGQEKVKAKKKSQISAASPSASLKISPNSYKKNNLAIGSQLYNKRNSENNPYAFQPTGVFRP